MAERRRIGEVYEVVLGDGRVAYFHHICNDETQLGSAVIRVFNCIFSETEKPELSTLPGNGVMFHAHVFTKAGKVLNIWQKVGHIPAPSDNEIVFKDSRDYGVVPIGLSNNWDVWRTNGPRTNFGRLPEEYFDAEIGVVKAPPEIVKRILTGTYRPYMRFR